MLTPIAPRKWLLALLVILAGLPSAQATIGAMPTTLKGVAPPAIPGLLDGSNPIVVDKQKAIALGKALFWDSNVGSDGVACASCHFHAGADRRIRNQLAPGGKSSLTSPFDTGPDGLQRGPNQSLKLSDFPLTQTTDPLTPTDVAGLSRLSNDVVGSAGSFGGTFQAVTYVSSTSDQCARAPSGTYHLAGIGTRRVIERNAPTVINAVFNHRVLWDGRANNIFNGSSAWGPRDPNAGIWVLQSDGQVVKQKLALANAALASQAMTAPVNDTEMGCQGRTMADLGRKLLYRNALEHQKVHVQDSVLGSLSAQKLNPPQTGLTADYLTLVQQAFAPRYWSYLRRGPFGKPAVGGTGVMAQAYNQAEANFSLFFGIALQLYQATLVSDDSPFDRSARDAQNLPTDLTPAQLRGLQIFRRGECARCHVGPNFTSAAVDVNAALVASRPWAFGDSKIPNTTSSNVVSRLAGTKGFGYVDTGFAATGVAQDGWDVGLAGKDDWGNDIAQASQYLQLLAGNVTAVKDPRVSTVRPCDLPFPVALNQARASTSYFTQLDGLQTQSQSTTGCLKATGIYVPTPAVAAAELLKASSQRMLLLTDAAFKIPTLRNVELTGPYMHNGSMATLDHVIEFYARGGNFAGASKQLTSVFPLPELQGSAQARSDLIEFLKSLTDERVRYERAPFDHPELKVMHGHTGDRTRISATSTLDGRLAQDDVLVVPEVGAGGRNNPLLPFSNYLAP